MIWKAALPVVLLLSAPPVTAEIARIEAGQDATLIEDPAGARANGSGTSFFVGRIKQPRNGIRRGLVWFDVASVVPERALIESAALTLYLSPSNPEPREIRLHRVLADWGEGTSASSGGGGVPAEPGDATWLHTFFDLEYWVHSGGQFVGHPSGSLQVIDEGYYTWSDDARMARDVRIWRSAPHRNFGWVLIGDETTPQTAKSFASRENPEPALRPVLELTYRIPREPGGPSSAPALRNPSD